MGEVAFDRYTMTYAGLSAGTTRTGDRGDGGWYEGVIRDGNTVTWRCGHLHKTRDQSYPTRPSARDCAMAELRRRAMANAEETAGPATDTSAPFVPHKPKEA